MARHWRNHETGRGARLRKDERRAFRSRVACRLTYSGRRGHVVFVGEGLTIDISPRGLGVRGNQPVHVGMLLSLCLQVPGEPVPLFIEEARVMWVNQRRFGVELRRLALKNRLQLRRMLRSSDAAVLNSDHPVSVQVPWT